MNFITENIAIGSRFDARVSKLPTLQESGITAILNLALRLDLNLFPNEEDMGKFPIEYHKIGLFGGNRNTPESLMGAVSLLEQLLVRHKVLVCDRLGVSRSVVVVCLYLVKNQELTFPEAVDLVRSKRKKVEIDPGLMQRVEQLLQSKFCTQKFDFPTNGVLTMDLDLSAYGSGSTAYRRHKNDSESHFSPIQLMR